MLIEAYDIKALVEHNLNVQDRTFVRAIDVVQRSPLLARLAVKNDQPLYALPGGGRVTKTEIINMLKEQRHGTI